MTSVQSDLHRLERSKDRFAVRSLDTIELQYTAVQDQGMTYVVLALAEGGRIWEANQKNSCTIVAVSVSSGTSRMGLTGESRIDPTRFIFIRKMNKFPICFMISLLGNCAFRQRRGPLCQC
jgi:hypothetical protein